MAVLAAILWGILVLLGLLVAVPFHAQAVGSFHEAALDARAEIAWGWGALSLRVARGGPALHLFGLRLWRFSKRGRREENRREAKTGERSPTKKRPLRALVEHRRALTSIAARFARALRLRLRVAGVVGAGDPADTALLSSAARLLGALPGVDLALQWDWIDEELEIELDGRARVWIAHLLLTAVVVLLARENRAALRAMA
jgi:hypothetical protein